MTDKELKTLKDNLWPGADDVGSWANWSTRMHKVILSLSDAPLTDTSLITRNDAVVTFRNISLVPEIIAVKAEHLTYTISKTEPFWVMAFDTDDFCFPLLTGVRFDGYDKSIVRIVGGLLIPVSPGTPRVTVHWHNFSDSFVVTVTE